MLQLFNSLTGRKERFKERVAGHVDMYVCGDTVYDFCHVGHARSKIAFDVVRRYLMHRGYRVRFVRNITDIDDRIIQRAAQNGEAWTALTERFTRAMHEDYARLNVLPPDVEPRATQHIAGMLDMIGKLIAKGFAYAVPGGDVLYSVSKFDGYGTLSGKQLSELRAGERVAIDVSKQDPLDFVLWKRAKPGEPSWPSPWGEGRPGWHIECSAMTYDVLGANFDIHGGGADLKFPHHENEIAQSCAATGERFATYWLHNGFVNVDDTKMSKSLGNFSRIRDIIGEPGTTELQIVRHPEVLRWFLMASHYTGPINYSLVQIEQADASLERLYIALKEVEPARQAAPGEATARFEAAMDDDFNTPEAAAVLQGLATAINRAKTEKASSLPLLARELLDLGKVLGVLQLAPDVFLRSARRNPQVEGRAALAPSAIDSLIAQRVAARKARNFAESDRIRGELTEAGVVLEDKPDGSTVWRRA
jgi:cysteinyl-tRNA synthetase